MIGQLKHTTPQSGQPVIANHQYYHWLDVVRGFAAISILLVHYTLFFMPDVADDSIRVAPDDTQPFYWLLWPFMDYGYRAVQFFWMLSGFVFANTYFDRQIDSKEFAIARFARLYPLHFATLILVAILQIISHLTLGDSVLVGRNTVPNFISQLFFSVGWFGELGAGFNAPIWSVSLELGAYAVFLAVLRSGKFRSLSGQALLAILFLMLMIVLRWPIMECLAYFFVGSTLCVLLGNFPKPLLLGAIGAVCLGLSILSAAASGVLWFNMIGSGASLILMVGSMDRVDQKYGRLISPIGSITYALYLTHVPLMIVMVLVMDNFGVSRLVAQSPLFFVLHIVAAITIAALVYRYFEKPVDRKIRQFGKRWTERRDMAGDTRLQPAE